MQLYLQSAVVERGIGPDELPGERAEVVVGSVFANLVADLHHHRHRRDAVCPRRPHRLERRRRGQGARAVRGPLRRGALRRRAARREPARRGDPAGDRRLRRRGDVRVREGDQPASARGARLRRRGDGADRDRDARRDRPGPAGDRPARGRPGGERRAAAGDAVLRLAALVEPGADGQLRERADLHDGCRHDGDHHLGPVARRCSR